MLFQDHLTVWLYAFKSAIFLKSLNNVVSFNGASKNTNDNSFPFQTANPVYIVLESLLWIGLTVSNFVVPDQVEVDLAKVKDKGGIFGTCSDPLFDFDSFLLISFCQALEAFALEFDVESVVSMEEHVDKGIAESEVVDVFELIFEGFGIVLEFSHVAFD